jgi:Spy/CpxP family protein refolding chaperone
MRTARIALALALAMLIASPLMAKDSKKKCEKPGPAAERIAKITKPLTLTDAEKTKLCDLAKQYDPKFCDAAKKCDVLTADQKKACKDAEKAAKDAGKKGKEIHQAGEAAVKLTDEQKTKKADADKAMKSLEKEFRGKVMAVLTPDQQAQLKKAHESKKK